MPPREWRFRAQDILDSIRRIKSYTAGLNEEDFLTDEKTVDAVTRNFQIIGEAANKLPEQIKIETENIPWRAIKGLRNILTHEYFGVDLAIVYATIDKLDELETGIRKVLSDSSS